MNHKIDISVIIPMYNSENYIKSAIDSVLKQEEHGLTYEIIVVDDVSKDNSRVVVRSMKDDRIILIELNKNQGTANARNTGIRIARGEWIQFLDSDDTLNSDIYNKFESAKKPEYNCYLFSIINQFQTYNLIETITNIPDKRAFGHFGVVWNKFIRKDICIEFGEASSFEDNCFIIDMMNRKELRLGLIEDAFYLYNRNNESSKMANFNVKEYERMCQYYYCQISISEDFTKMYILGFFLNGIFRKEVPLLMRLKFAVRAFLKLYSYLPRLFDRGFRNSVTRTKAYIGG